MCHRELGGGGAGGRGGLAEGGGRKATRALALGLRLPILPRLHGGGRAGALGWRGREWQISEGKGEEGKDREKRLSRAAKSGMTERQDKVGKTCRAGNGPGVDEVPPAPSRSEGGGEPGGAGGAGCGSTAGWKRAAARKMSSTSAVEVDWDGRNLKRAPNVWVVPGKAT